MRFLLTCQLWVEPHLRSHLGLEDPLGRSFMWLLEVSVPHNVALSISSWMTWQLVSPRANDRERARVTERAKCLLQANIEKDISSFLPYTICHSDQHWYNVGGYERVCILGSEGHLGYLGGCPLQVSVVQ